METMVLRLVMALIKEHQGEGRGGLHLTCSFSMVGGLGSLSVRREVPWLQRGHGMHPT